MSISTIPVSLLLCCVCWAGAVASQEYPSRPIKLIVANPAGTGNDVIARIMAGEMAKSLAQPIAVENRVGANSVIGFEYVARQEPADGHTLLLVSVPGLATLPSLVKGLRFDPLKDLPPVIGIAEGKYFFGSSAKLPWKTFAELVAQAKANPGKLNYGTSSPLARLTTAALMYELGLDVVHVPYAAGGGAYIQAVINGDVHMVFAGEATVISLGDKFRVLAVTGDKRQAPYLESPTFAELGHPRIPALGYSLNVRNGTPKGVIDKLYTTASKVLQQPSVRALFAKNQFDVVEQTPEMAARKLADVAKFLSDVARRAGIEPQ